MKVCLLKPSTITRAILLAGTSHLPAKCLVCNTFQHNGFYGCFQNANSLDRGRKRADTLMVLLLILLTQRAQNVLKSKLWKNHAKLQVKEKLSMELKAHRGLMDSNIQYYRWEGNRLHALCFALYLQMSPSTLV